jgi:hypothetical protein
MPLLDHFHPPMSQECPWEGVHSDWASSMARQLNRKLPPKHFRAVPHISFGGRLEIDVATIERGRAPETQGGGVATAVWAPARPTLELGVDFVDLDVFEIQVFEQETGNRLVAAVEIVSLANKDRPAHREAFVTKCASYLAEGVSLVIVDVVTARTANLHRDLLDLLRLPAQDNGRELAGLYAVAYRTFTSSGKGRLQAWEEPLAVGKPLPTLPLWVTPELVLPLDLETSYRETCDGLRLPG